MLFTMQCRNYVWKNSLSKLTECILPIKASHFKCVHVQNKTSVADLLFQVGGRVSFCVCVCVSGLPQTSLRGSSHNIVLIIEGPAVWLHALCSLLHRFLYPCNIVPAGPYWSFLQPLSKKKQTHLCLFLFCLAEKNLLYDRISMHLSVSTERPLLLN